MARALTGASMNWNFKSSFVNYVGNLGDGKISTSGVSQGGGFNWSGGSGKYNPETNKGLVQFPGTVQFSGHGGIMNSKFSNMRVQFLGANSAALIANVVANDMNGASTTMNGVQIGSISLAGNKSASGNTMTWSNAPVTLTAAGAKAFGGFYQAGERLDPITIKASLGGSTNCDAGTGTLSATGLDEQAVGVAGVAVALLVAGAGIAVVANRRKLVPIRK